MKQNELSLTLNIQKTRLKSLFDNGFEPSFGIQPFITLFCWNQKCLYLEKTVEMWRISRRSVTRWPLFYTYTTLFYFDLECKQVCNSQNDLHAVLKNLELLIETINSSGDCLLSY